jgi:hypothetical protein
MRDSILGFHHRAIIDDHGKRTGNLLRNGQGEIESPPGDQSDFYPLFHCRFYGAPVGQRHFGRAIEQCSINVEGNQAHTHVFLRWSYVLYFILPSWSGRR